MAEEKNCCALCGKTPYWVFQTKKFAKAKKINKPKKKN
jgi:hypothetical protein